MRIQINVQCSHGVGSERNVGLQTDLSATSSRKDFLEEVPFALRLEKEEPGQGILGRGNCMYKGPEAGTDVDCSETSKGARMAGLG